MARKRERFERTDVPREGPYRNVLGVVVVLLVVAAVAVIVNLTWNRANLESRMGDNALGDAIGELAQYGSATPGEGYVATEDQVGLTLLLTANGLEAQGTTLEAARVLAVNATKGTATLVNLPVDLAVTSGGEATTLSDLFTSGGAAACVVPLGSAAGVTFDGVVVATEDVLEEAAELAGSGALNLVQSASGFLSKIRTNMDAAGLLEFAESLAAVGVSNLAVSDAPLAAETAANEDGETVETGRQTIDQTQFGVLVGTIAAAS